MRFYKRQLRCLKRKGIKGLRGKSPNTPNPKTAALTAIELEAIAEELDPGVVRRIAGKLGRTPVEVNGKTA
jgi:hypothetical protein